MITKLIIAVIILGIISTVPMVHAAKGKSFNTERYTIGYNDGQADAVRDKHGLNGHGYDDRCPEGHSDDYCRGARKNVSNVEVGDPDTFLITLGANK